MKNSGRISVLLVLAGVCLLAGTIMAACASTPQHRSTGQVIDDMTIQARVKAKLIDSPRVDANEVNLEVKRGVVTLLGWVSSDDERGAAGEIARSVSGVKEVDNRLRLKSEPKK